MRTDQSILNIQETLRFMKSRLANMQTIIILKIQNNLSNDFLNNLRRKFKSSATVVIKCAFSIENLQPAPVESSEPILNVRYYSTKPYKTTFFNNYVFFSLKNDISKRVIINGQSGSSRRFNRFIYLNFQVLNENSTSIR